MICETILYYIFNIFIYTKIYILSKCKKTQKNFDISQITIYDTNELFKIINKKQIQSIISDKWYVIKQYNMNAVMIDIQYFYNNQEYNIIYKYPNGIDFPIDFKHQRNRLLYTNDEINKIVMKYAGPMKDFYENNHQKITMNDIFIFNNMNNINNTKDILIVNNELSEKYIKKDEIITLEI